MERRIVRQREMVEMLAIVDEDKRNRKWTDWILDSELRWVSLIYIFH